MLCTSLTNLIIPNSVTNIGAGAFEFCSRLTNITFLGNSPILGSYALYDVGAGATVYYYGTTGWSNTYGGLPTVMLYPPPQWAAEAMAAWACNLAGSASRSLAGPIKPSSSKPARIWSIGNPSGPTPCPACPRIFSILDGARIMAVFIVRVK